MKRPLSRGNAHIALLTCEQKAETILGQIEDGYYEVDLKGHITSFNRALTKIIGYSA